MARLEKAPEENPYYLSIEKLTYPGTRGKGWLKKLAARQREGIDHGVRPQLPRDLPSDLMEKWRKRVWKYYVEKQPPEVRQAIKNTVEPEIEWDWKRNKDSFRKRTS